MRISLRNTESWKIDMEAAGLMAARCRPVEFGLLDSITNTFEPLAPSERSPAMLYAHWLELSRDYFSNCYMAVIVHGAVWYVRFELTISTEWKEELIMHMIYHQLEGRVTYKARPNTDK